MAKTRRGYKTENWWLIVNAKPIQTFFMEKAKSKEEIKKMVNLNHFLEENFELNSESKEKFKSNIYMDY